MPVSVLAMKSLERQLNGVMSDPASVGSRWRSCWAVRCWHWSRRCGGRRWSIRTRRCGRS